MGIQIPSYCYEIPVIYAIAIPLAFVSAWLAYGLYVFVAVMWLIPDRRIEKTLAP